MTKLIKFFFCCWINGTNSMIHNYEFDIIINFKIDIAYHRCVSLSYTQCISISDIKINMVVYEAKKTRIEKQHYDLK